jgi:hypothetical protein
VAVVELHVEMQRVREQVDAQQVRRRPADALAYVGRTHGRGLGAEADRDEDSCEHREAARGRPCERVVDERTDELRARELQARRRQQQDGEQRDTTALVAQVDRE